MDFFPSTLSFNFPGPLFFLSLSSCLERPKRQAKQTHTKKIEKKIQHENPLEKCNQTTSYYNQRLGGATRILWSWSVKQNQRQNFDIIRMLLLSPFAIHVIEEAIILFWFNIFTHTHVAHQRFCFPSLWIEATLSEWEQKHRSRNLKPLFQYNTSTKKQQHNVFSKDGKQVN